MKGIISSHSALNAYQRQTAVEPVSVREAPATSESGGAPTAARAARVSISAEARALAEGDVNVDRAKVERLRQSLQAGSLKFDSQLIAQRLVDQGE
jgi:flagellar biosynthesis anti-sigma factor FlgM